MSKNLLNINYAKKGLVPLVLMGCLSVGCSSTSGSRDVMSYEKMSIMPGSEQVADMYKEQLSGVKYAPAVELPVSKEEKKNGVMEKSTQGYALLPKTIKMERPLREHFIDAQRRSNDLAKYAVYHHTAMHWRESQDLSKEFKAVMSLSNGKLSEAIDDIEVTKAKFAKTTKVKLHKAEGIQKIDYEHKIELVEDVLPKRFIHKSELADVEQHVKGERYYTREFSEVLEDIAVKYGQNYKKIMDIVKRKEDKSVVGSPKYQAAHYEKIRDLTLHALYYGKLSTLGKESYYSQQDIIDSYCEASNNLIDVYKLLGKHKKGINRCYEVLDNESSIMKGKERADVREDVYRKMGDLFLAVDKKSDGVKKVKKRLLQYYSRNYNDWKSKEFARRVERYYEALTEKDVKDVKVELLDNQNMTRNYFVVNYSVDDGERYMGVMEYDDFSIYHRNIDYAFYGKNDTQTLGIGDMIVDAEANEVKKYGITKVGQDMYSFGMSDMILRKKDGKWSYIQNEGVNRALGSFQPAQYVQKPAVQKETPLFSSEGMYAE